MLKQSNLVVHYWRLNTDQQEQTCLNVYRVLFREFSFQMCDLKLAIWNILVSSLYENSLYLLILREFFVICGSNILARILNDPAILLALSPLSLPKY